MGCQGLERGSVQVPEHLKQTDLSTASTDYIKKTLNSTRRSESGVHVSDAPHVFVRESNHPRLLPLLLKEAPTLVFFFFVPACARVPVCLSARPTLDHASGCHSVFACNHKSCLSSLDKRFPLKTRQDVHTHHPIYPRVLLGNHPLRCRSPSSKPSSMLSCGTSRPGRAW